MTSYAITAWRSASAITSARRRRARSSVAASGRIARALVLVALAALTAAAWIWLLPMHMAPMGSFPDGPPADPMPWSGGTAMFLFIMRSVMMAGMMIPSAVPMVLVHDRVARGNADAVHFHCCVIDGVFAGCEDGQVHFAEAAARTPVDLAAVQQQVRARACCAGSPAPARSTRPMRATWPAGTTAGASRWMPRCASKAPTALGLERLLRYCARPPPQSIQHPPIELGGDVSYGSISCPFPGAGREGNDLRR
jgi:hypothetical protein